MSFQANSQISGRETFYPREHAVLARWLGLPCRSPVAPPFEEALRALGLPEAPDFGEGSAAVASILLSRIASDLPGFSYSRDGEVVHARPQRAVPILRALLEPPVFLFAIDWALSAPGFSWPCEYHCTFVPGYDRYVVTCSYDCEDVCGAADVALGAFEKGPDLVRASLEVIEAAWRDEVSRQGERWQIFLSAGAITEAQASGLADKVWEEPDWQEDADEDDLNGERA